MACPGTLGSFGQAVSAAWVAGLVVFLFGISVFLKLGAKKDSPAGEPQRPGLAAKFPRFARYMARMPPRWRQQMAAIGKIDRDHEAAELVIRVAVAISKADGDLSPLEARAISDICSTLGVPRPAEA